MFGDSMFWIALFLLGGAVLILFASRLFTGREYDDTIDDFPTDEVEVEYVDDFPDDIVNVPGHDFLYFSLTTRDVYRVFIKDDIEFLAIFTSNNHLCKYINGRIMEVVDGKLIAIVHTATLPN